MTLLGKLGTTFVLYGIGVLIDSEYNSEHLGLLFGFLFFGVIKVLAELRNICCDWGLSV